MADKSEVESDQGVKPKGVEEEEKPALSPLQAERESREGGGVAEAPEIRKLGKHHSSDKSVAGGGVIIGGLVTAIFAAVASAFEQLNRAYGKKLCSQVIKMEAIFETSSNL
ncbi:unnamed protein product [Dovyalis caffra]|uniref:Uncharacterized protein n=1 Tax=Dovyalis caffra TaxID=77055 RepID=A0AAV1QVX8_9ROSI|nr:unnamed protein product [Dovyalis caffra]